MTRTHGTITAALTLIAGAAWVGEIKRESLPANSISRIECEKNDARIKDLPQPDAGVVNL